MLSTFAHRLGTQFTEPFAAAYREMASEDFSNGQAASSRTALGSLCLSEDDDCVYVEVDVPGMTADEIELVIEDGKLSIRGTRRPTRRGPKCWRDERLCGHFQRTVALADAIDTGHIEAGLVNGMLSITLPKKSEAKAQRIPIQANNAMRISQTS